MGAQPSSRPAKAKKGGTYWSPFGPSRWSAVVITDVSRVWAQAVRVNPSSGEPSKRKAKVKMTELVARNPKLKGKDRPVSSPSVLFHDEPEPAPIPPRRSEPPKRKSKAKPSGTRIAHLLDLLADKSTIDDW